MPVSVSHCVPSPRSLRPLPVAGALIAAALAPSVAHGAAVDDVEAESRREILVVGQQAVDANPNANPDAPYKVERSSDSKWTEPLRDTPRSITVIPKEVIEDVGATSFRDVARSTPGVTLGTGEGGNAFGDRIFIRGFEARNDVYIDGMRDPGVTSREVFALEQIEIVKGPSSTFGGRGTTGGSVSLQSKRALDRDFIGLEASVGTEDHYRGTVDINQKLSDRFAVRVNGLYHKSDTPGRDYVWSERYGAAIATRWEPVDALTIDADYYHYRYDGMSDYGHPFDSRTRRPFDVDQDNFYGAVGRDFLKAGSDIGTVTIRYEPLEQLSLRTMSRYGEVTNSYVVSVPQAPCRFTRNANGSCPTTGTELPLDQWTVGTSAPQRDATTQYFSNITDATLRFPTFGIDHTLVTGLEYSREKVTNRRLLIPAFVEDQAGNPAVSTQIPPRNLLNPDPVLGFSVPIGRDPAATPSVVKVESVSLFLLDTLKFSPQFEAMFGVRFDSYDIRSTGAAGATPYDRSQNVSFFNYQASLVYKPVEPLSLYASYSTSSNPSGEQLDSTSDTYGGLGAGTQGLKPERNKAIEAGVKYEIAGGRMLLTAAAFQIDKDNAREQTLGGVYELVGKLRSKGAEVGINGNLTPRLALFGGYTYLDATIRQAFNPALEGAPFANVPKHNFSMLATYALSSQLTVGGQAYYRSRVYGGQSAAGSAYLPSYWRFDAVARYRVTDNIEARVNVLNIADKRYYDAIYRSGTPFSYVAPGRSATLSVSVKL